MRAKRRRGGDRVAVESAITRILAESRRLADAIPPLIETICVHAGWSAGALWTRDPGAQRLRCEGWWRSSSVDIPDVAQLFEAPHDGDFPRKAAAVRLGLTGAFAFPVIVGDESLGVLEFFSLVRRKPDAGLLDLMRAVGQQIGLAIERWRAEEALQESEERYRIVGETAADAIFTIDRDDVIRYANPAVERIFGYEPSELLGKTLIQIIPERFRPRHLDGIRHFIETGRRRIPWTGVRLPGLHRDGHEIPLEISFGVYRKGDEFFFTGVARDITAQMRAEEERARLLDSERAARIEASSANRAKDEFLATLSHELRTPLTSILGWASILTAGDNDDDTLRKGIESISRSAKAQAQLIEDVLDVSSIVAGKLALEIRPVKLLSIVETVLNMVRPAVEAKGLRLETRLAAVPPAMGDRARIEQILWNLIGNAIKFTPAGGRIDVSLERRDGSAEIRVNDTGEGIAPEFLPLVFERFSRAEASTTRAHGGLGLGLAIARHLVELHGGTIKAESAGIGKGSTFTITLPLLEAAGVGVSPPAPENASMPRLDGLSVLVVDDDEEALGLIKQVFLRSGAEVTTAKSAAEALGHLDHQRVDVLISDIAMPGEDGYTLIRKIREREEGSGRHLPAVALTAVATTPSRDEALNAGFDDYRRKPIEPLELAQAVAELTA
jgi:PAS domain S-box-containing protein